MKAIPVKSCLGLIFLYQEDFISLVPLLYSNPPDKNHKAAKGRNQIGLPPLRTRKKISQKRSFYSVIV